MVDPSPTVSESLLSLVETALGHALKSIEKGGPLVPFVLSAVGEKLDIQRCIVGADATSVDLGASVEEAKKLARSKPTDRVAVASDGRITGQDGIKSDAILVEAFESGSSFTLVVAQTYRPAGFLRKTKPVGPPAFVGRIEPMW
jgi:hypothetical protein